MENEEENLYVPYNYSGEEAEASRVIPRQVPKNPMPDSVINEKAFYASSLNSENKEEDYVNAKQELKSNGSSGLVDHAEKSWDIEQSARDHSVLLDIVSDPSLTLEQRKHVVLSHAMGGAARSSSLRDKYKLALRAEDNDDTQADREHRDGVIDRMSGFHQVADEGEAQKKLVEDTKLKIAQSFAGTATDAWMGLATNFIPLKYGASVASAEYHTMNKYNDSTINKVWETIKAFVFPGESNNDMNKYYHSLDDYGKAAFIKDLGDSWASMPGTFDYNKWEAFRDIIESPEGLHPVFRHLENVAGILDVFAAKGFITAGFAGGFMKASLGLAKHLTTITPSPTLARMMPNPSKPREPRVDPTLNKETPEGSPNPPTGPVEEELPRNFRSGRTKSPLSEEDYINLQRPRVQPLSPAGTLAEANPKKARETFTSVLMEDGDEMAKALGTSKGDILSDTVFPKLDQDVLTHPDLADALTKMDKYFSETMKSTEFDPFLINVTQRDQDKAVLFKTIKENKGAHYQQSNSVVNERIDEISGLAVYGRNADYGFSSAEEATASANKMKEQLTKEDGDLLQITEKSGQWYVERPYSLKYDPYSSLLFGKDSVSAKVAFPGIARGIDASGLARSSLAKWVWQPTQRLDPRLPQGAFLADTRAAKVEGDYKQIIEKEIRSAPHQDHLEDALIRVQEDGEWSSYKDLHSKWSAAGIKEKDINKMYRGYSFYKRLTEYQYHMANRHDRRIRDYEGQKGIYDLNGTHLGYGVVKEGDDYKKLDEIYDIDNKMGIVPPQDLKGRTIVKLVEPVMQDGKMYDVGVMGANTKLGELPEHTLPRIEGYIPRINTENFYIIKTPKKLILNGKSINDLESLRKYTKTIAAESTKKDALTLMAKLQKEYPDHVIDWKRERSDASTSILTDHQVFKEILDHSRKRGERLPTLYGKARLENPLEALWSTVQKTVRLDQWKDYETIVRHNWVKAYGEFTKGEFPNVLTDIKAHAVMTEEDIKLHKAAQRVFEQYTNQRYKVTMGDELWKDGFHLLADSIEDVVPKWLSQNLRDTAGKGNLLVRAPKALASTLFINLNPPRQWTIQTQQLIEWSAMDANYLKMAPTTIPGLVSAIMSRASILGDSGEALYKSGRAISGMNAKEFDDTFKAIYNSGLPHSVDLNMMLHGAFHEAKLAMTRRDANMGPMASMGDTISRTVTNIVKFPGVVGKSVGYSPAELANTIGTWLFTRERWKRQNPGKNWNTPEHIAKITADAWEIGGAMTTRAGAMPYQDGALSLLFQFQRIGHAKTMDVFSSKVFTPAERGRLAATRALLWGKRGVPAAGIATWLLGEYGTAETQQTWDDFTGGFADKIANSVIDMWLSDPSKKKSDLAFASALSPIPEHLPYVDFIVSVKKALGGETNHKAFPALGGMGNAMKAATEISNIFKVNERNTAESLTQAALELAKLTSGYNNYAKAKHMAEFDRKADKFNNDLGISVTRAQVVAQLFGIISKEEEHLYKIQESLRDRANYVETRAQEIHTALNKHAQRYGDPEFHEWVRTQEILNYFTPEELRRDVEDRVDQLQLRDYESKKESAYTTIMKHLNAETDKYITKGLALLAQDTSPEGKEKYKQIIDAQNEIRKNNGN